MYLLHFKDLCLSSNKAPLPKSLESLSKEFEDVFPKDIPHGLPPLIGLNIKWISLIPDASLPNRPTYRNNPQETQEIQKQVEGLLEKGWVRESLSLCACSSF